MFGWMRRQYARRIVNVNVNILLANALAVALTAVAVHYSRYLGIHSPWHIVLYTFAVDIVLDVALYYVLHWVANHWPRQLHGPVSEKTRHLLEETPKPSFFRDATVVQAQRLTLSPLFYALAFIAQKLALHGGVDRAWTVVIGFASAIVVTRTIHTVWMLWSDRAAARLRVSSVPPHESTFDDLSGAATNQPTTNRRAAIEPRSAAEPTTHV